MPPSPLDYTENESKHIWIAREIAFYLLKERFSEYNVMEEIPEPEAYELRNIRYLFNDIKDLHDKREEFTSSCKDIYKYFGYQLSKKVIKEIEVLFRAVNDEKYLATYNPEKYNKVVGTIHSAKDYSTSK